MQPDSRWQRLRSSRAMRVTVFALLALWLGGWAIEAFLVVPLLRHHVRERSGCQLAIDSLRVGLNRVLEPTLRLTGVRIENAAWADPRPFATAGEIRFTFAWHSLSERKLVIRELLLVDADIDLELRADGTRNWRLANPDDRGPGRVKVLAIDARNSRIRFAGHDAGLVVEAAVTPLPAPRPPAPGASAAAATSGLALTRRLELNAQRGGQTIAADLAVSDVLTFADTGTPFALDGSARSGTSTLKLSGTATDLFEFAHIDVDLDATLRSFDALQAFAPTLVLPTTLPLLAQAHLKRTPDAWAVSALRVSLGHSALRGEFSLRVAERSAEANRQRRLEATLQADAIDWHDFASWRGGGGGDTAEALRGLTSAIDLRVATLSNTPLGRINDLRIALQSRDRSAQITTLGLGVADGRIAGRMDFDGNQAPARWNADLRATGLRLAALSGGRLRADQFAGALDAHGRLQTQGDSWQRLVNGLSGRVDATLQRASMAPMLAGKLSLDGAAVVAALLKPDRRVAITCSVAEIDIKAGIATAKRLWVETADAAIVGSGTLDLPRRSVDLVLTPHRKTHALLGLDKSLRVRGPLAAVEVKLGDPAATPRTPALPAPACGGAA